MNIRKKFVIRMRVRRQCSGKILRFVYAGDLFSQFPYVKKAGKARFRTVDKKLFFPEEGENSPFHK